MKTLIVTPAYSHTHSLLDAAVARSGLPWMRLYEHSDLVRVRSILISAALDKGADVIVLIDADNIPMGDAIERIAAQATPERAVFGLYRLRDGHRLSVDPIADIEQANAIIAAGQPLPIQWGGLGLAAIHRDSLALVAKALPRVREPNGLAWYPFCLPFVSKGLYHGDDRSLCTRLRELGVSLIADPTLDVRHAFVTLVAVSD